MLPLLVGAAAAAAAAGAGARMSGRFWNSAGASVKREQQYLLPQKSYLDMLQ